MEFLRRLNTADLLRKFPKTLIHHGVVLRSRTSKNVQRIARFYEQNAIAFWNLVWSLAVLRSRQLLS